MPTPPDTNREGDASARGMRILGVGVDVVEVGRLARLLEHDGRRHRILATILHPREEGEVGRVRGRTDAAALALRLAAKEACLKALRRGIGQGPALTEVLVTGAAGGPRMHLTGRAAEQGRSLGVRRVHAAWTATRTLAAAFVVLEG